MALLDKMKQQAAEFAQKAQPVAQEAGKAGAAKIDDDEVQAKLGASHA